MTYGRYIERQHPAGAPQEQDSWHDGGGVGQRDEGCVVGPEQTGQGEVEQVLIGKEVTSRHVMKEQEESASS